MTRAESLPEAVNRQSSVLRGLLAVDSRRPPEVHSAAYVPEAPRRDRDAYLAAGYRLLGDRGFDGLTVAALCSRMGTSKGSFYHHFDDLPAFVDVLVARWQKSIVQVVNTMHTEPDPRRRFEVAANWSFAAVDSANPAIRAGAVMSTAIAAAMPDPHRVTLTFAATTFADCAEDEDTGRVLAAMIAAVSVGVQHRFLPIDRAHWLRIVAEEYRRIGVGNELLRLRGRPQMKVHTPRRLAPVTTTAGSLSATTPAEREPPTSTPRQPSIRAQYFAGAWDLLAEQGSDAVTTRALAERLGLTKGSFRHQFGSMPDFQRALADHWEQSQTAPSFVERNPWRRLELLLTDLLIRPSQADTVWRAWGHANPIVGDALRRADRQRERALGITLAQLFDDPDVGLLAEMTLGFALGLHRWYPPFDPEMVARAAVEWARRILGIEAEVSNASGRPALVFSRR